MAKVDINDLEVAIGNILEEYGDLVFTATEQGLNAGQKVLIKNLKASSPRGTTKETADVKRYYKGWKGKKKYKLKRYVGNTKTVKGKGGEIPLSNVLEYGEKSKHKGLIKRTYTNSLNEIAQAMVDKIKKV